jgi:hypothetical protein
MYYQDPDKNMMEFQIDLAFAANPVGESFDPDQLAARFDSGEPVDDLIFRSHQKEHEGRIWRNDS